MIGRNGTLILTQASSGREPSTVPAAPPMKYVLGYRSQTRTLNANPITDHNPNPKINKKQNDTGMKLKIELYLKVDFIGTGVDL